MKLYSTFNIQEWRHIIFTLCS